MSIWDSEVDLGNVSNYHLSMIVGEGNLTFSVVDLSDSRCVALEEYDTTNSHEILWEELGLSAAQFKSVSCAVNNNYATLIPTPFFREDDLAEFLGFNFSDEVEWNPAHDTLSTVDSHNVYHIDPALQRSLKNSFPGLKIQHYSTTLIETNIDQTVFLCLQPHTLHLMAWKEKQLLFCNHFDHQTPEDVVYYLLFVYEQLGLNPLEDHLAVAGKITVGNETWDLIAKYVKHVSVLEQPASMQLTAEFENSQYHIHFPLLMQHLCA